MGCMSQTRGLGIPRPPVQGHSGCHDREAGANAGQAPSKLWVLYNRMAQDLLDDLVIFLPATSTSACHIYHTQLGTLLRGHEPQEG